MAALCGGFLLLICLNSGLAQSLDWAGDITLFGTGADESHPALAMNSASPDLQGFCILSGGELGTKASQDYGVSWSSGDFLPYNDPEPRLCAVADGNQVYAIVSSTTSCRKNLYIFPQGVATWSNATHYVLAPLRSGFVQTAALGTDLHLRPNAPHVFCCWIERDTATSYLSGWFARSSDQGRTFFAERQVFVTPPVSAPIAEIGIAAVGDSSQERVIVAATVDRPGSIDEAITIYTSDDAGESWSSGLILDNLSFPQRELGIAAQGMMVMVVYARKINAAAQRDVFFTYSPDGGTTFSPPQALTEGYDDDYRPSIVLHESGTLFSVFYLTNDEIHETATVWMRTGSMERPWEIGLPIMVSSGDNAQATGGLSVCSNGVGVAAAWTSRFQMGDLDVKFDASWRGTGVADRMPIVPSSVSMGQNFPNPFNGVTVLPFDVSGKSAVDLDVSDLLGRTVSTIHLGSLVPGKHQVVLDLSAQPTGVYFASMRGCSGAAQKMVLLK